MPWTAFHKLEIDPNGLFARLAAAGSGERRLLAVGLKAWPSVRVPCIGCQPKRTLPEPFNHGLHRFFGCIETAGF